MGPIGPLELTILLVIVLVIFGPKRLPQLGRQLGSGMREFKDSVTGNSKDDDDDDERPQLSKSQSETVTAEPVREDEPARPRE